MPSARRADMPTALSSSIQAEDEETNGGFLLVTPESRPTAFV
jgi:hypothetical protein